MAAQNRMRIPNGLGLKKNLTDYIFALSVIVIAIYYFFLMPAPAQDADLIIFSHMDTITPVDNSMYGYSASVSGTPEVVKGVVGSALYFNGIDTNINWGDTVDGNYNMTVMLWVKTSDITEEPIGKYGSGKRWYIERRVSPDNSLWLDFNDAKQPIQPKTNDAVVDGTWHHVVFVLEGTRGYSYLDGTLNGSDSDSSFTGVANNHDLIFGGLSAAHFWEGTMDEVRIYNRSLSSSEIRKIYHSERPNQLL